MFCNGHFIHTLDAKGRLTIPVQFREPLTDGLVVTLDFDDCLLVYPKAEFEELANKLDALPSTNQDLADYRMLTIGGAFTLELDSMGRVLIPSVLRDEIKLEKEAVVMGDISFLRIWRPDKFMDGIRGIRARKLEIKKETARNGV